MSNPYNPDGISDEDMEIRTEPHSISALDEYRKAVEEGPWANESALYWADAAIAELEAELSIEQKETRRLMERVEAEMGVYKEDALIQYKARKQAEAEVARLTGQQWEHEYQTVTKSDKDRISYLEAEVERLTWMLDFVEDADPQLADLAARRYEEQT